jgi:hypothetical protein
LIPRLKCVQPIIGDDLRKTILLKSDADRKVIEAFAKDKDYELSTENVNLTYDNMSMS